MPAAAGLPVAGNANSGGHNARIPRRLGPTAPAAADPGMWPWERRRAGSRLWTHRRIRRHLVAVSRDAITALVDAHCIGQVARDAIAANPAEPRVGRRDAYAVQANAHVAIKSALSSMGLWPLDKARAALLFTSDKPKKASKVALFERPR